METLRVIFNGLNNRLIQKWDHYIEIYEQYFNKYKNKEVNILEIGVSQGGSLEMWKKYFGENAHIYGIDINPRCKELEDEQVTVFIGEQEDRIFWKDLKNKIPKLDILIDDGGHTMIQQIVTFEEMFDHVKDDGIYLCEDTHTSYMYEYHGGYHKKGTFIEYSKNFVDYLHAWAIKNKTGLTLKDFTRSVFAVHFYTSMIVIEKKKMETPVEIKKGKITVGYIKHPGRKRPTLLMKAKKRIRGIFRSVVGR